MRRIFAPAAVVLILALSACSARQQYFVEPDGSGTAEIEIVIHPVLASYISDLNSGLGMDRGALFDISAIRAAFLTYPDLTLRSVEVPNPSTVHLDLAFSSIDALFDREGEVLARILSFEESGTERTLTAELDRRAIERALAFARIAPDITEILLPPAGDMRADEYRDYLSWALEEYETDEPISDVLSGSLVRTVVTVNGRIIEVTGGTQSGRSARFTTPLLELLTTGRPERYSIRFESLF